MPKPSVVAIILLGVVALAGTVDRGAAQDRRVPASPADAAHERPAAIVKRSVETVLVRLMDPP